MTIDWFKHPQYLSDKLTKLTEPEGVYYLREAWKFIYGEYPENKTLAILYAQTCLETGRYKSLHCYCFGNIKKRHTPDDGHYYTMYRCNEIVANKVMWFDPPHPQTHFRAFKNALDGAVDYLKFLQKPSYASALKNLKHGNVELYIRSIKAVGYFTASLTHYLDSCLKLSKEFHRRSAELLSFKPEPQLPKNDEELVSEALEKLPPPPSVPIIKPVQNPEKKPPSAIDSTVPVVVDLADSSKTKPSSSKLLNEQESDQVKQFKPDYKKAKTASIAAVVIFMVALILSALKFFE